MTEQRTAWCWGLASIDAAGNTLDVWYPELTLGEAPAETSRPNHNFGAIAHDEADARGVRRMPVFTVSKLDDLKNKKVGVQTGTTGEEVVVKLQGKTSTNIKRFESPPLAPAALAAGGQGRRTAGKGNRPD